MARKAVSVKIHASPHKRENKILKREMPSLNPVVRFRFRHIIGDFVKRMHFRFFTRSHS